mgnify:CR=1 FL=1
MTPLFLRSSCPWARSVGSLTAVAALVLLTWKVPSASSQRIVKKIESLCPLGYVDTLNGKCSTLGMMTYTVKPIEGHNCSTGWVDVGGGYCRKK